MTTDIAKVTEQLQLQTGKTTAQLELKSDEEFHETVMFENGRGVSILRNRWSYGGHSGLFEVAVLNSKGDVDFSTPVTDDVLGWQTVQDVLLTMKAVSELPAG